MIAMFFVNARLTGVSTSETEDSTDVYKSVSSWLRNLSFSGLTPGNCHADPSAYCSVSTYPGVWNIGRFISLPTAISRNVSKAQWFSLQKMELQDEL